MRHIGFSTHGPLDIILEALNTGLFSFVNLHFYYFFQRNLPAVQLAGEKDIGVFIISPNEKGGLLWKPSEKVASGVKPLTAIQFSARFCLSHSEITTLSMGMHAPEHFPQNLAILNDETYLSPEDAKTKTKMDASMSAVSGLCTLCDQCLPCPEDINIPEILRFRNLLESYDMVDYGKYRYNMLEGKGHWFPGTFAFNCTECGDCLPRCPESLDIPELLKETHRQLFDRTAYTKTRIMGIARVAFSFLKKVFRQITPK